MGFTAQPNLWQCGPFALKHALMMLGVFVGEAEIARRAGTSRSSGTDEDQLRRVARRYDCDMPVVRHRDAEEARRSLAANLDRGFPVLLCVNGWGHWITAVKRESGQFIVLDSQDHAVLSILTWGQLRHRWAYREMEGGRVEVLYDLHPVIPRFRVATRTHISLARARHLRRAENRDLARLWDEYVRDLVAICRSRTPLSENVISMGTFLRRHEKAILYHVDYWHGQMDRRRARRILKHMHFVADTLGMVVHEQDETSAIAAVTAILTLWAAAKYGTAPVYDPPPPPRRRKARRGKRRG